MTSVVAYWRIYLFIVLGIVFLLAVRKAVMGRAAPWPASFDHSLNRLAAFVGCVSNRVMRCFRILPLFPEALNLIGRNISILLIIFVPYWLLDWGLTAIAATELGSLERNLAPIGFIYIHTRYVHYMLTGLVMLLMMSIFLARKAPPIELVSWHVLLWPLCAVYLAYVLVVLHAASEQLHTMWMLGPGNDPSSAEEQDWMAHWLYFGKMALYFILVALPVILVPALTALIRLPSNNVLKMLWHGAIKLLLVILFVQFAHKLVIIGPIQNILSLYAKFDPLKGFVGEFAIFLLGMAVFFPLYVLITALIAAAFLREHDALSADGVAVPPRN